MTTDAAGFADHYNRIASLAPSLAQTNPGVTGALAQASVVTGGLPNNLVESTAGLQRALTLAQNLSIQTTDIQAAVFNRLDTSDRNLLTQLGYTVPQIQAQPKPKEHHSWWSSIGNFLGAGVSAVGNALNVPIQAVQHSWRTIAQNAQTNRSHFPLDFVSPHDWMTAWNQTKDGKKSYDIDHLNNVQQSYDPATYTLAKQMNDGLSFDEIAPVGSPQRDQLEKLSQQPAFKKAYDDIQSAHLSPGRSLVYGLGIPDPTIGSAHVVSGALDGTFDVLLDPTLRLGGAFKVYRAARYGLTGARAEDIDRMFQTRSVRNGWSDISTQINTIRDTPKSPAAADAVSRITTAYPSVQPLIQPLLDAGVHDVNSAQEFLRGNVGLGLLLKGQPFREMPLMPHALSPFGEAYVASKTALRKVVDWRIAGPRMVANPDGLLDPSLAGGLFERRQGVLAGVPIVGTRWATLARRISSRVPTAEAFNPLDPSAADIVRRTALSFLPTWQADQISATFLTSDLGGKRTIYKGLLGQLMHASGATQSEQGRQFYGELMDDLDQWTRHTAYSAAPGVGIRPGPLGDREVGFLEPHMTETWGLPSFKGMVSVAGRVGVLDRIGGLINRPGMDKAMRWWRWQVLTRPGFGLRAGADELLGAVMRGGGTGLTRAFLAQRAIREGKSTPWDPAVGLARVIAKALPEGAAAKVNNVGDLAHQWTLGGIATVLRKGAEIAAGPDMVEAARTLSEDPFARQSFSEILHQSRYNDVSYDGSVIGESTKQGFPVAPLEFGTDGSWEVRTANGWEGSVRWAHELEKLTHDPAGFKAARLIADGTDHATSIDEIRQVLASDSYAHIRKRAEIADIARDGRRVSKGEVTSDVALHDWAQDIHDHAMSLLSAGEGDQKVLIRPVLDHIVENGDSPGASLLAKMEHRPEGVVGKTYVPIAGPSGWDKFSDKAFQMLAVRPLNFLSRQPLTTYHYAQARKIYSGLEEQLLGAGHGTEAVEDLIHRHSLQRALEHTVSYVHNPKMRTQLSVVARNIFPFRHAEEGFYTRWSRTVRDSPQAVRKMQLMFQGMSHSGMIQNDQQTGQPVFVYPGTGFIYDAIARAHNLIPGLSAHPIPIFPGVHPQFTSPIWYLNPGLTQVSQGHVYPQGGPLATLSVGIIRRMFPESELPRQLERQVAGEQGAGKPLWGQFVPTVLSRLYSTWGVQSDTDGQLASATRSAIAYLDAIGQSPPDGASPEDVDKYINRVKAMTRTLLTMRVALGFVAPAAPSTPEFDQKPDPQYAAEGIRNMRDEFVMLTKKMPYDEAIGEFQRLHPDDSPFKGASFLTSQSKSAGDLFLPSTKAALDWMSTNTGFLKNYKLAAPLLIPDDPGKFSYDAYREQLALGLRSRRSVGEFYNEIKIQNAERQYYSVRDQRDNLIAEATANKDSNAVQSIQHAWDVWSQELQAVNPLFAQYLAGGGLRAEQRSETMDEVLKIALDPKSPIDASLREPLQQLAAAWAGQQADLHTLSGYTTSEADALRKQVREQFSNTVSVLVAANPRLVDIYNRVLRPMEG